MPTIITKPFDQEIQSLLSDITDAYHAGELSNKALTELPPHIHLIQVDDNLAGYAVIWEYSNGNQLIQKAERDYFSADEKYLEKDFYIDVKSNKDFIFIEALDILKDYEKQGHAAFFINWLKEKYPTKKMYVYTLDKTRNFWYKQQFEALGSTVWMTYN